MLHVLAYTANTFGVSAFDMLPVTDEWIGITNNHFFPQIDLNCYGGWFGGAFLNQVKLFTPQSRAIIPPALFPIQQSILPPDRPHIWDRRVNPVHFKAINEISLIANIAGTVNGINTAILIVGDQLQTIQAGWDIYGIHFTSTTAAVANTWTTVTAVVDQPLPAGVYTVVGSQHVSTNAIAHRFNFRTGPNRPGFLSMTSVGNISEPSYYQGGWGVIGQFNTQAYPFFEVYCNGADASHDFVLFAAKTG